VCVCVCVCLCVPVCVCACECAYVNMRGKARVCACGMRAPWAPHLFVVCKALLGGEKTDIGRSIHAGLYSVCYYFLKM
jgi:hypothetical protein